MECMKMGFELPIILSLLRKVILAWNSKLNFCFKINNFQCGNYGIGGHYGTHPDFYDYDESKFYDPESKINRISTVMTVLEAPEAGE